MLLRSDEACLLMSVLVGLAVSVQARAEVIHACVSQSDGQLRVVSEDGRCHPGENALAWNTNIGRASTAERTPVYRTVPEGGEATNFAGINFYLA